MAINFNPNDAESIFGNELAYQKANGGSDTPTFTGYQNDLRTLQDKAAGHDISDYGYTPVMDSSTWQGAKQGYGPNGHYVGLTPEETSDFNALHMAVNGPHKTWLAQSGIMPALALTAIGAGTAGAMGGAFSPASAVGSAGAGSTEGFSLSGIGDAINSIIPSKASILSELGLDGGGSSGGGGMLSGIENMLGLGGDTASTAGAVGGMHLASSDIADSLMSGVAPAAKSTGTSVFDKLSKVMGIINAFHGVPGLTSQKDIQNQRAADSAKAAQYSQDMINGMNTSTLPRTATPYIGDYSTYGQDPMAKFYDEPNPRMTF